MTDPARQNVIPKSPPRKEKTDSKIVASLLNLRMGSLFQVAAALLWLPQAALVGSAIQSLTDGGGLADVILPAVIILTIGFASSFLDMTGTRLIFRTARKTVSQLQQQAAHAIAARSPIDTQRHASGMSASIMAEQTEAVLPYLVRFQPVRMRVVIVPTAILLAVAPLSWIAALALLVAAPLIPLFMALIGWRAKEASAEQMVQIGDMNAFLLDRLRGLTSIRSLDAVDATAQRFRETADLLRKRTMAVLRVAFLSSAVLELFSALGVAMVAVYVGFHLLGRLPFGTWGSRLTLGEGLFILLLAPAFFEPLQDLSSVWHDRASGDAALDALDRLSMPGTPLLGPAAHSSGSSSHETSPPSVMIDGMGFRHSGAGASVFQNFTLCISPGEKVALLGHSGSGKSTLLSLIAGLAPVSTGQIIIAGQPMTEDSAAQLRKRMAWIGQKPHLFSGTLRSNITMGRGHIGLNAVSSSLRFAALDDFAKDRHGLIGEGGTGLSGGEAARLALARAAADGGADIILADEPTAHLDTITADEVAEGILALAANKTLIIATHDEAFASRMDRIVRLDASA